jgi:hypothetical protein
MIKNMKSLLLIASLALASAASAAETLKVQSNAGIAPAPTANLYAAAVPEPSHAMLLMLGCVGLAARRGR